jgi:hypothetical protein
MKVRLTANATNHGGQVAQSVEQRTENPCVECSIHSLPTTRIRTVVNVFPFRLLDLFKLLAHQRLERRFDLNDSR